MDDKKGVSLKKKENAVREGKGGWTRPKAEGRIYP